MNGPMKLGMLGMWHSHAHGIVRQVAEHQDEFRLVGSATEQGQRTAGLCASPVTSTRQGVHPGIDIDVRRELDDRVFRLDDVLLEPNHPFGDALVLVRVGQLEPSHEAGEFGL